MKLQSSGNKDNFDKWFYINWIALMKKQRGNNSECITHRKIKLGFIIDLNHFGRINTVQMSFLPKAIYRVNVTLSKFQSFFTKTEKDN